MVRCVKLEKMVRQKCDNDIFRLKAVSLLRQIEEAKEFLSYHKPSLGFWGEHLLRGFLRENLPNDVKITQGFITLDEDFDSIRQKLYYLIHKKEDNVESISPQCDIIFYRNNVVKSFGKIDIVNAKDVVCVIEVKCSINRKGFKDVLSNFKRLSAMGVQYKYIFIYNAPKYGTLTSYFYPKQDKMNDEVIVDDGANALYDHGDEAYLPSAIIGVNRDYLLCQDLIIGEPDKYGYVAYRLTKEKANLSCLQLFLSSLFQIIEEEDDISKKPFEMDFDNMICEYSFGLYN